MNDEEPYGLGDVVANALHRLGITPERVTRWVGRECGCEERKQKLNSLSHWATRVLRGKPGDHHNYLRTLMGNE